MSLWFQCLATGQIHSCLSLGPGIFWSENVAEGEGSVSYCHCSAGLSLCFPLLFFTAGSRSRVLADVLDHLRPFWTVFLPSFSCSAIHEIWTMCWSVRLFQLPLMPPLSKRSRQQFCKIFVHISLGCFPLISTWGEHLVWASFLGRQGKCSTCWLHMGVCLGAPQTAFDPTDHSGLEAQRSLRSWTPL